MTLLQPSRTAPEGRSGTFVAFIASLAFAMLAALTTTLAGDVSLVITPAAPLGTETEGDNVCDSSKDANTDADDDPATNAGSDTDGDTTPDYLDTDLRSDELSTEALRVEVVAIGASEDEVPVMGPLGLTHL